MIPLLRISIIIPVLNEADRINDLLGHLRQLPGTGVPEIIVVDGDPDGGTVRAIADPAIRKVLSGRGRARQMNAGAAAAAGDILLFLHADTRLPERAYSLVRDACVAEDADAGAFSLGIDSRRWYFRITERYASLRTRITRIPFGDQAIFIRKTFFDGMGGYRDIPIMEDIDLMRRIRKDGGRVAIIGERVRTSARRWEREGVIHATLRNWLLQLLYCCGTPPERLARFYR